MLRRYALAAVALALVTWWRVHLVDALPDQGYFAKYLTFADAIVAGHIPRARLTDLSPAYLWLVVALRALEASVHAIRALQIAALSVAAALCGYTATRWRGLAAGIAAAVFILLNRAALVTATELEPETLIVLAISAALALLAHATSQPRNRATAFAAAGLATGLAVTARPVALLAAVLIAAWLLWRDRRAAISFGAAALLPIVVVVGVNAALAGEPSIMEPGTGLYDGNNPLATGAAGVLPRVVADLDRQSNEPDYLHVAYRLVAARATSAAPSARLGNRYWSAKALAWMRVYPSAAVELLGWKALLAVHSYDIYDLATTKRKAAELSWYPNAPFALLVALALACVIPPFARNDRDHGVAPLLFALATLAALVAFNVSSRQRDALLPPLAILAGAGLIALTRRRTLIVAVLAVTLLLSIDIPPQREDDYGWWQTFTAARMRGRPSASVLRTGEPPAVPPDALRASALRAAQSPDSRLRFDAAIALEKCGDWNAADAVLTSIDGYRPRRENNAVSSVAYYRARTALHLGRDPRPFLDRADDEAHGDAHVLALRSVLGDRDAARRLDLLHDPFTRDYALALADLDVGRRAEALHLRDRLLQAFPEWRRPATIR